MKTQQSHNKPYVESTPFGFGSHLPSPLRLDTTLGIYGNSLIPQVDNHTELFTINGKSLIALQMSAGDKITLTDKEGGQTCQIATINKKGQFQNQIIPHNPIADITPLCQILLTPSYQTKKLNDFFRKLHTNWNNAKGITLFGSNSNPGNQQEFLINEDGFILIAAVGDDMDQILQNTNTPIFARVHRKTPRKDTQPHSLPSPLADPIQSIRVHARTAEAFVVKAGEYIQVLDVNGRQCSDFQCFDLRKIDKNIFKPLDVTATRSIVGRDYPMPGIFAKSYDEDMTALVEVVQDTCGRHDAFGLACFAKHYDDMGYPGHANCTDNFNLALKPYNVPARSGWMAQNYFYNTNVDKTGTLFFDEPWSRPGDFVLLKALTDLLCISSACPDDTSPANGWETTDIHVRTYAHQESFSKSIAYRVTPQSEPTMTVETAFHPNFSKLTKDYVEYRGFWLPNCFSQQGPIEEYWACRENAVITDLSALRKAEITGPDAEALLQLTLTRDIKKLSTEQVVYSAMCYPHGGMLDDCTLTRLGDNNFRWIGGEDYSIEWMRKIAKEQNMRVLIRSSTNELHNLALQGPNSRKILEDIIWTPPERPSVSALQWFRFTVGRIAHAQGVPVVVSRTGYTGELGYEIWCHPKHGNDVLQALFDAGEPFQLKPLGLAALDMLRIEAGLVFAGQEFCEERNPFEAGIGFTVPLKSKEDDFIGKQSLIRLKEHPRKKFVGLKIHTNEAIAHGDCIHIGKPQIGIVTSAVRSPILKETIALAQIDVAHSEIGTEVEIGKLDGHQKRILATVSPFPHYDPAKTRVRNG